MKKNILSCSITYLRCAAITAILLLMPASGIMAQDLKPNIPEGEGTAESPFIIRSLRDLQAVADYYNSYSGEGAIEKLHFRLAHDINITFASSMGMTYQRFTGIDGEIIDYAGDDYRDELLCDYRENKESNSTNPFNRYSPNPRPFTPIGTADHPFNGVFDGGGRTIANLFFRKIDQEPVLDDYGLPKYDNNYNEIKLDKVGDVNQDYSGLFAYCDGATIVNLGVVDSYVEGKSVAAAVCANAKNTEFHNVYSSATVKMPQGENAVAAAIVGKAEDKVLLDNCYNVGKVGTDGGNPLVGAVADDASVTYSGCYTLGNCAPAEGLIVAAKGSDLKASALGDAYVAGINGHPVLESVAYTLKTHGTWNYDDSDFSAENIVYADASLYIPKDNTMYLIYNDNREAGNWIQNIAFLHNMVFYGDIWVLSYDYYYLDGFGFDGILGTVGYNLYSWYLTDKKDLDALTIKALTTSLFPKEIFYHRDGTKGYNSTCLPFEFSPSNFGTEKITGADGKKYYNVEMLGFMDDSGYDNNSNQIIYDGETGNGRNGVFSFGYIYTPHLMNDWGTGIFDVTYERSPCGRALLVNTPNLAEWNLHIIYTKSIGIGDNFFEHVDPNEGYPQYDPELAWVQIYDKPFKLSYTDQNGQTQCLEPVYSYRTFYLGTFKTIKNLMDYRSWAGNHENEGIDDDMAFIQDNYITYKLAVRNGKEQFVKGVQGSGVYPFRTFIICPDFAKLDNKPEENYLRMTILAHAGGTVTGIGSIDEDGKVKITPVSDVYSLDGRLVRKGGVPGKSPFDGLAPGIYVSGGKKMVIGR